MGREILFGNDLTVQRLDEPRRGTVFFDGPIIVIRRGGETYAAEKLDKLVRFMERKAMYNGRFREAAKVVAGPMVARASRASEFWGEEGFDQPLRESLVNTIADEILAHFEHEYEGA